MVKRQNRMMPIAPRSCSFLPSLHRPNTKDPAFSKAIETVKYNSAVLIPVICGTVRPPASAKTHRGGQHHAA